MLPIQPIALSPQAASMKCCMGRPKYDSNGIDISTITHKILSPFRAVSEFSVVFIGPGGGNLLKVEAIFQPVDAPCVQQPPGRLE